ncbi:MAG: lysozyme inhibitor LprI family protein [Gallionella sp.]|jgi:uncharacterized protein
MKIKFIAAFLLIIISHSLFAASFDCQKAGTAIEKSICNNEEVSALDSDLSNIYKMAIAQNIDLKQSQREWVKERNLCTSDDCLLKEYNNRISFIKQLLPQKNEQGNVVNTQPDSSKNVVQPDAAGSSVKEELPILKAAINPVVVQNPPPEEPVKKNNSGMVLIVLLLAIGGGIYFGLSSKCPKCKKWFSEKEIGKNLISSEQGRKTVTREDKHRNSKGEVTNTVHRKEQIDVLTKTYEIFHECKNCQHKWETLESKETEL